MNDDPISLKEVWTSLDGRSLLYRTNAKPKPPADAPSWSISTGSPSPGDTSCRPPGGSRPSFRTYVPDLPGFGRSERPPKPLRHPGARRRARPVPRPRRGRPGDPARATRSAVPIIGDFVDQFPDRVERAIFVGPAGGQYNLPIRRGIRQLALAALREPLGMAPIASEDYLRYGPIASIDLLKSMLRYPTAQRLAGMRMPMLAVIGSRDPLISESWLRREGRRRSPT